MARKKPKKLRPVSLRRVSIFNIANRRGYAAICMKHLTEGRTPRLALARMAKALKRKGFALGGRS